MYTANIWKCGHSNAHISDSQSSFTQCPREFGVWSSFVSALSASLSTKPSLRCIYTPAPRIFCSSCCTKAVKPGSLIWFSCIGIAANALQSGSSTNRYSFSVSGRNTEHNRNIPLQRIVSQKNDIDSVSSVCM